MKKWILPFFFLLSFPAFGQDSVSIQKKAAFYHSFQQQSPKHKGRKLLVGGLSAGIYGGSFLLLNSAWYKGYDRTGFHTFNDIGEWLQVDKLGHAWTVYQVSRVTSQVWRWGRH